jgi:hypothetical protein
VSLRHHRDLRSILLPCVLALAACATQPASVPEAPQLPEAEPDPLAFLGIAFPAGAPVRALVITTRPAGVTSEVLACTEHENVVGFVPPHDVDFVNLYFVQQFPGNGPMRALPRYLVAELWHYRPSASVKIRHQWVIWQDEPPLPPSRADYTVLIEDFTNRVIEERTAGIAPGVLGELAHFYTDAVDFFIEHPPENPDDAGLVVFGGPYAGASPRSVTSRNSPSWSAARCAAVPAAMERAASHTLTAGCRSYATASTNSCTRYACEPP